MRMHRLEGTLPNGNRDDRPQQRRPADARQHCSAPTLEVSRRQRPASQISFCRSGTPPEEVNRRRNWPSCVGSRPGRAFLRSLHGSSLSPFPKLDPVCSLRNFGGQRFSEFLTAGLSRRRSRVRAPSSPPFLSTFSQPFQIFAAICRGPARDAIRHQPTRNAPNTRVEL